MFPCNTSLAGSRMRVARGNSLDSIWGRYSYRTGRIGPEAVSGTAISRVSLHDSRSREPPGSLWGSVARLRKSAADNRRRSTRPQQRVSCPCLGIRTAAWPWPWPPVGCSRGTLAASSSPSLASRCEAMSVAFGQQPVLHSCGTGAAFMDIIRWLSLMVRHPPRPGRGCRWSRPHRRRRPSSKESSGIFGYRIRLLCWRMVMEKRPRPDTTPWCRTRCRPVA